MVTYGNHVTKSCIHSRVYGDGGVGTGCKDDDLFVVLPCTVGTIALHPSGNEQGG